MLAHVGRQRRPFLLMSAAVLGLCVGTNLVIVAAANALWLRPPPVLQPDRVVTLPGLTFGDLSRDLMAIFDGGLAGQLVVDRLTPWRSVPRLELNGSTLETLIVTTGYFGVLGVPIQGRDFTSSDDTPGAEPVAIISERLRLRLAAAHQEVIGSWLQTRPLAVRVVGIAPARFTGARRGEDVDIWIPVQLGTQLDPLQGSTSLAIVGRLRPGQTPAQISRQFESQLPGLLGLFNTTVVPIGDVYGDPASPGWIIQERTPILLASLLGGLVVLVGCATIASLVLVHYEQRRSDLATRLALGAGRRRLVYELSREVAGVALLAVITSIVVGLLGTKAVSALTLPGGVDLSTLNLSFDWRVYAIAVALVFFSLTAAVAVPIARFTRVQLVGELHTQGGVTVGSLRIRQALLAAQVSLAVAVMVIAGLCLRSVGKGSNELAGFDLDRTVFVRLIDGGSVRPLHEPELIRARHSQRIRQLISSIEDVPGVIDVAEGTSPVGVSDNKPTLSVVQVDDKEHRLLLGHLRGSPNLLNVLGIPVIAGRHLTGADVAQLPTPAVISAGLARRLWPAENAVGQIIQLRNSRIPSRMVVGIASDFAFGALDSRADGVLVTAESSPSTALQVALLTHEPSAVAPVVQQRLRGQGKVEVSTGRQAVARDLHRQRLGAAVFAGFGAVIVLIGAGSVFGLVAYLAESRRRDFAVRMALGAGYRDVISRAVSAALGPVAAGVIGGLGAGALLSRLIEALLVGVTRADIATHLGVVFVVTVGSTSAALLAAWRLRTLAPAELLRAGSRW